MVLLSKDTSLEILVEKQALEEMTWPPLVAAVVQRSAGVEMPGSAP